MQVCLPIQTPLRKYGVLWMNIPEGQHHKPATLADLQNLGNQAAIALKGSLLLVESRRQAQEIKSAFDMLTPVRDKTKPNLLDIVHAAHNGGTSMRDGTDHTDYTDFSVNLNDVRAFRDLRVQQKTLSRIHVMLAATCDQTVAALTSALDAQDRQTEGPRLRVSRLVVNRGESLAFSRAQLKVLERGSILHDIAKIGISDTILHKPGPLDEREWKLMRQHSEIGAHIVEGIPFLQDTLPLIRHHQERWDGNGYPMGLKGVEIPSLARIFADVDAFDAFANNRPYRQKISTEEPLQYL